MVPVSRRVGERLLIEDVTLTVEAVDAECVRMSLRKRNSEPVIFSLLPGQFLCGCYNVRIGVIRVRGNRVRLGLELPAEVQIERLEGFPPRT